MVNTRPLHFFLIAIVAMALVLLISNILVQYPINDWITWGAFSYPFAFLVTDLSNRLRGAAFARRVVYTGFLIGILLSWWFADPRIAFASGCAFLFAQLGDVWVFDYLRRGAWWRAPMVSSALASTLDTLLFFSVAFAGSGLPWLTLAFGDLFVKILMILILLPPYRWISARIPNWID